ncbi:MAG: hypothetical protein LBE95_02660 [Holosporaceae bacterium]|nr:hypothetical protein [Holosporaceae bacterium]
MFWDVTFDDGFLYLRAQIIQRNKRAQVSLGDFMLHAELGLGDSGEKIIRGRRRKRVLESGAATGTKLLLYLSLLE